MVCALVTVAVVVILICSVAIIYVKGGPIKQWWMGKTPAPRQDPLEREAPAPLNLGDPSQRNPGDQVPAPQLPGQPLALEQVQEFQLQGTGKKIAGQDVSFADGNGGTSTGWIFQYDDAGLSQSTRAKYTFPLKDIERLKLGNKLNAVDYETLRVDTAAAWGTETLMVECRKLMQQLASTDDKLREQILIFDAFSLHVFRFFEVCSFYDNYGGAWAHDI
jgi:hypothetical protein